MWIYEKKLQCPVHIKSKNIELAKYLITQYGGPDGELGAALRYLNQRYSMPTGMTKAICNDIGTEEFAHLEIIATMVHQLLRDATPEEMKAAGLGGQFADHDKGLFYTDATGNPWTATYIQCKGNPVADLHEDLAAEEKARVTYEWLITLSDDEDVNRVLRFLREREIVHFQRFGEALMEVQETLGSKKYY